MLNKIKKYIHENNMTKILLWFFIYTVATFAIGILCKVLVAWHVNDMHSDLSKTHDLFATAAAMPGANISIPFGTQGQHITAGDVFSLEYLSKHMNDVSAGDGDPDRFLIFKNHIQGHEDEFADLNEAMKGLTSGTTSLDAFAKQITGLISTGQLDHLLSLISGFQNDITSDANYALSMQNEANVVFWLQIALIVLTLAAYPFGIYKLWQMKHIKDKAYTSNVHKRFIFEYLVFLVFFIGIDTYATYLLIAENVPMTFWNTFSVCSMAIPTGFAFGSLIYIHFLKKEVTDPINLKINFPKKLFVKSRGSK